MPHRPPQDEQHVPGRVDNPHTLVLVDTGTRTAVFTTARSTSETTTAMGGADRTNTCAITTRMRR